jgi:NAD(P)-dependent dehydrogenase (short-subunit alcohol dehydrogenase family)
MSSSSKSLVWLITGVNSGLGQVLAQLAASHGHTVIGTVRSLSKFPTSLTDAGVHPLELEMTASDAALRAAVDGVVARYGSLDVLINNAGFALGSAFEESDDTQARRQFDVNLFAPLSLTRAALAHMRPRRSGVIIFMSSQVGVRGWPGCSMYSASKFAMEGAGEAIAGEVKGFGIRVHIVQPGPFRTNFLRENSRRSGEHVGNKRIDDYEDYVAGMKQLNNNQEGDPEKGMQIVYDIIMGTGIGAGKEWTLRVPLGSECYQISTAKIEAWSKNLEEMKEITMSTDM